MYKNGFYLTYTPFVLLISDFMLIDEIGFAVVVLFSTHGNWHTTFASIENDDYFVF